MLPLIKNVHQKSLSCSLEHMLLPQVKLPACALKDPFTIHVEILYWLSFAGSLV